MQESATGEVAARRERKEWEMIRRGSGRWQLEKRKMEEKMKRDQINDNYLDLIEKQRLYFKTVKDFQEECRKNEILLKKLERKQ
ncbi:putative coiled-coil domain-containing protein [Apostichopus japonicus]|uniref:Coiled-coil domain-containing protein 93 n=1 Tax=Stichopus japonicus TaxID=307972 RepID=A0A2G8L0R2_STIJA|nr:putative coiled-coil domain-containing protein [Apostichopus japonicus]